MKVCGICNRVYEDHVIVCESDGQRLIRVDREETTQVGPAVDWNGPMAGDVVGSYRLEKQLAEGGMGRIFKATHLSLQRPVAIKFLLPEHAGRADLVRRFFNEARSVNAIQHPHIIDIFDFIEEVDEQGRAQVYMVMEYLDGEDARRRLRRDGPFPPKLLISVAEQVAETLAAAHEAGILHRDLKPDNIFLCRSGKRTDFVKLLDFGAAKAFGHRPGHHLTRPGVAIGTPEYMSPEQIMNQEPDERVDIYGLGCVCYELLTGSVPFRAANVAAVLAKHTNEPPEPIAKRRRVPPSVPAELEQVVLRCMAKAPKDRYADLWAVAEAFRSCATSPASAPPAPTPTEGAELEQVATIADRLEALEEPVDDLQATEPLRAVSTEVGDEAAAKEEPQAELRPLTGDVDSEIASEWDLQPARPDAGKQRALLVILLVAAAAAATALALML